MLKTTIKEIIDWCDRNHFTIFYGFVDEDSSHTTVYWNYEIDKSHVKFLETAKNLGASLVVLNDIKSKFHSSDKEIIELKEYLDEEDLKDFNKKLKRLESFKEETAFFSLTFIKDNTFFEYAERAEWADDFDDLNVFIDEHDLEDEYEYENEVRDKALTRSEIKALSRQLAEDDDFQKCKNDKQRKYVASKVFQEKYEGKWVLNEIIDIATSIVKLEIEPEKRKELKSKIKGLSKQGLSDDEISEIVGLTKGQLRRI